MHFSESIQAKKNYTATEKIILQLPRLLMLTTVRVSPPIFRLYFQAIFLPAQWLQI